MNSEKLSVGALDQVSINSKINVTKIIEIYLSNFSIIENFIKKNNLKENIFQKFKSVQNLKKLNQDIYFVANFGRDIEYYTGIVFEIFSERKEIARGGRYDDLLKSLGAKKNIPAVGAAINLKNI